MTIDQFIQQIETAGLGATLEKLAKERPDATLQLKRMENLREALQTGKIPGEEAFVQSNRIGYAISQLIESMQVSEGSALAGVGSENENSNELFRVVSTALRQYLNITEEEHEAVKSARENQLKIDEQYRLKTMEEMVKRHEANAENEWSPIAPKDKLPLEKIGELLAGKQLVQAAQHLAAHGQGTEFQPEVDRLTEEIKQLARNKNLGVISEEYFRIYQNRLVAVGKDLLRKLLDRETKNTGSTWWKQIWPFS